MALNGNRLGPRGRFVYVSDTSTSYQVRTDSDNAAAGGFAAATNEPVLPKGMKMRYLNVYLQDGTKTYRKKLYVAEANSTIYAKEDGDTVAIDGATWTVSGRTGEKKRGI